MNDKIKELKQTERDLSAASKTLNDAIEKLEALTQKLESDEPEIPEGFRRHDGGSQPVPDFVRVSYLMSDGDYYDALSDDLRWSHKGLDSDIIAYKVTSVPTLTIDDVKKGDDYYVINRESGITSMRFSGFLEDYAVVFSGSAYATRELAECALEWGCVSDCVKAMLDNKGSE